MANLQKNHVKIDVFNEPKYHFDPNQVHSLSFRPQKTPNKQKNGAFVTFFFVLLVLRREERPSMHLVWVKSVFWFVKYVDFYVIFL